MSKGKASQPMAVTDAIRLRNQMRDVLAEMESRDGMELRALNLRLSFESLFTQFLDRPVERTYLRFTHMLGTIAREDRESRAS